MSLQEQIAEKLNGNKIGHYYACWCPIERHRKPALLVYPDYAVCKSCGWQGNLKKLNDTLVHSNYSSKKAPEVSLVLPRWKKWIQKYGDLSGIAKIAHKMLSIDNKYLKKRKIEQFYEQGYFGILDGWFVIPVFDQQRVIVDLVVRALRQNAKYVITPKSKEDLRSLYCPNWDRVISSQFVYIPFGIFDAWAFEAISLPAVTSITGKEINPRMLDSLKNKYKIIVPDYNEWDAAYKLQYALGNLTSVLRIPYPYGLKDCDDLRRLSLSNWKNLIGELGYAS
jgi:hypothetical protein